MDFYHHKQRRLKTNIQDKRWKTKVVQTKFEFLVREMTLREWPMNSNQKNFTGNGPQVCQTIALLEEDAWILQHMSVAKQRNFGQQSILCGVFKALMRSISRFVGENWPAGWSHPLSKPTAVVSTRKSFSRETTSFNSFLGGFMHIWVGRKWPKDWSLPQKLSRNLGTSAAQSNSDDVAGRQNNLMENTRQRGLVHICMNMRRKKKGDEVGILFMGICTRKEWQQNGLQKVQQNAPWRMPTTKQVCWQSALASIGSKFEGCFNRLQKDNDRK